MRFFLLVLASGLFAWIFVAMRSSPAGPAGPKSGPIHSPFLQPTREPHGLDEIRLDASDPWDHDNFGRSVAIDGEFLVAGAPGVNHPERGEDAGAAYVFQRTAGGWSEMARLVPSDPQPASGFGHAVAISGDRIAVGARLARGDRGGNAAGAVYLFERRDGTWVEEAKITAGDGGAFHLFGHAVDIDGDTLVVGARAAYGEMAGDNTGAAYVYHRQDNAWVEQARLIGRDSGPNDFFGHAVAVRGDVVAVGAYGHDDPQIGMNSGAVYIFQRREGKWFEGARLVAADASPFAQFGYSLALGGTKSRAEWLLVGANQEGGSEDTTLAWGGFFGAAYAFEQKNGVWNQAFKWKVEHPPEYGIVGEAVAIGADGRGNPVGAVGSFQYGGVYLFPLKGLDRRTKPIQGPNEWSGLNFGQAIAFSGPTLVVGSHWAGAHRSGDPVSVQRTQAGSVFLLDLSEGVR